MQWLLDLAQEHRSVLRQGQFYKTLAAASSPLDLTDWVRQLFYQSRDFISALGFRSTRCNDQAFRECFAQHSMEEADHPNQLVDWMREHGFLGENEAPTSVPATLDTLAVTAYCFRCIITEPVAHQAIALNLISEGVAFDFYSAVIPKLKELGIHTGNYWQVHRDVDCEHLEMGLDLIPYCEPDSPEGKAYARVVWEMSSLYGKMLDSWSEIAVPQPVKPMVLPVNRMAIPANYKLAATIGAKLRKQRPPSFQVNHSLSNLMKIAI